MQSHHTNDRGTKYQKNSLSLMGAISMGAGVMIGAGKLALTGQIAELAGHLFPRCNFLYCDGYSCTLGFAQVSEQTNTGQYVDSCYGNYI